MAFFKKSLPDMNISPARLIEKLRAYLRASPNIIESILALVIKLVGAVLSFGFSFLVARKLGATGNGNFALAQATALVAMTFSLMGLDYVLLRTMAGDIKQGAIASARGAARAALLVVSTTAIVVGGGVALFGAPLLQSMIGKGLEPGLLILSGLAVLPLTLNRMATISLRGSGGVLASLWLDGPQAMLISVLALFGLMLAGWAVTARDVVLLYFTTAALSAVIAWLVYRRKLRGWPTAEATPVQPMLRQGAQISFIVLSRMLLDWLVLVTLSASYSTFQVGQFRTAWQIAAVIFLLVTTFDTVAGPRIAAAYRVRDIATIRQIMRQQVGLMTIISAPLFVVTLGFPEWVLGLFGPDFVGGATALRILSLGQLVNILAGPIGVVLLMTGNERQSLYVSVISLAMLALCCLTLIPRYGLIGAALTTALIIAMRTIISFVMVRRLLRII
jgi:O-antigen/teichoic acid export membrane protein